MENLDFNDLPVTQDVEGRVEGKDEEEVLINESEIENNSQGQRSTIDSSTNDESGKSDRKLKAAKKAEDKEEDDMKPGSSKVGKSESEPALNFTPDESPQFLKTRKLTTIRLPWNEMKCSFKSLMEAVDVVRQQVGTQGLRLARLESGSRATQGDLKAATEVNEVAYFQINRRLDSLNDALQRLHSEVLGNNAARHESRLNVLGINMDSLTATLKTIDAEVRSVRQVMVTTRNSLERLHVVEAQLNNVMTKMNSTPQNQNESASGIPQEVSAMDLAGIVVPEKRAIKPKKSPVPPAVASSSNTGRQASKRGSGPIAASTPIPSGKRLKKEKDDTMTYDDNDECPWVFGCRMGQINSRTGKFLKPCTFRTTHFSLMKKHQNNVMHGEYLNDGVTLESTYRKSADNKQWICTKTNMGGKECKHPSSAIGTHNRHARQRCHTEDIVIFNTTCAICKRDFRCNDGLIFHTNGSKECANRRGFFGKDSHESDITGETCSACGTSGFKDAQAVIDHQTTGECIPQGSDASDERD